MRKFTYIWILLLAIPAGLMANNGRDTLKLGLQGSLQAGETFHIVLETQRAQNLNLEITQPSWGIAGNPFTGTDGNVWIPVTCTENINRLEILQPWRIGIVGIDNITGVRTDNGAGIKVHRSMAAEDERQSNGDETPGENQDDENPEIIESGTIIDATENRSVIGNNAGVGNNSRCNISIRNSGSAEIGIVTVGEILMRQVEVFNQTGKKVLSTKVDGPGDSTRVDLSNQRPGMYIIVVHLSNNEKIVRKVYRN